MGMLLIIQRRLYKFILLTISFSALPGLAAADVTLTMRQAEEFALASDPLIKSNQQYAHALKQRSIASEQWPDPKIKLGFQALPIDSFDLDQEPMTQLVLGYSQMLPRGDSLQHEAELMLAKSEISQADMNLRIRKVRLAVRQAWLEAHLQHASEIIISKNRFLFKEQLDVSQSLYSAGRNQQQDVLQAELELSLIDDRLQQIATKKYEAQALLARWVGNEAATYKLVMDEKVLIDLDKTNVASLISKVPQHPEVRKHDSKIMVSNKNVSLAEQKYKPKWGFELNYGKRSGENMDGSDRADFVSGMVNIEIPVFTEDKQDRVLSSTKNMLQASKYEKQDKVIFFETKIKQIYVRLEKLKTRIYLYDNKVLPQARQNSTAALNGYQSGVVSFFTLTRARSAELKAQLQRLKLYNQKLLAYAEMQFLVGEE